MTQAGAQQEGFQQTNKYQLFVFTFNYRFSSDSYRGDFGSVQRIIKFQLKPSRYGQFQKKL